MESTLQETPIYEITIILMNCWKQLPISLFHKCVVWCHWWSTHWSVHFPATSDRWYLHQHFARWTASTLRECSSTNTMTDVQPACWSATSFQSGCQAVSESKVPNRWIGCDGTQLANTVIGYEPIRLPCVWIHESYGVCTKGEHKRTTLANSQHCKKRQQRCSVS